MTTLERLQTPSDLKKGGVILSWGAVLSSPKLQYTTKSSSDRKFNIIELDSNSTTYHLNRPELSLGETYLFQVVSDSVSSNTLEVLFLSDKPEKPSFDEVVSMDNAVRLKMKMGASNGSVVSNINFLLSNGQEIFSVVRPTNASNEYTLDSLDNIMNYNTYEIVANAVSNRGDSDLSDGIAVTPSNYPNVATQIWIYENNKSVKIHWIPPSDFQDWQNEFKAVHLWYKKMSESEFTKISLSGDAFVGQYGYTINNLVNGENYHFKIAYENSLGLDEHTAWTDLKSFSPFSNPFPVTLSNISNVTEDSVDLTWGRSSENLLNGMQFFGYIVEVYKNGGLDKTLNINDIDNFTNFKVSDLTKGVDYTFYVRLEGVRYYDTADRDPRDLYNAGKQNRFGLRYVAGIERLKSEKSNGMTRRPFGTPSIPLNLNAKSIDASIDPVQGGALVLTWDNPEDNGGWKMSRFSFEISRSDSLTPNVLVYNVPENYSQNSYSMKVDGLTNGYEYSIKMQGASKNLDTDSFVWSSHVSTNGNVMRVPDAPINLRVDELDNKLIVYWDEATFNGGADINDYSIVAKRGDGQLELIRNVGPSSRQLEMLLPLSNGYEFEVSVYAHNVVGRSAAAVISGIPFKSQSFKSVSLNGKQISFSVNTNGRAIKEYHIVAVDEDNIQSEGGETHYFKVESENINPRYERKGAVEFSKTFSSFSSSIKKYLIIVESWTGETIYKTTFTDSTV